MHEWEWEWKRQEAEVKKGRVAGVYLEGVALDCLELRDSRDQLIAVPNVVQTVEVAAAREEQGRCGWREHNLG